MSVDITDNTNYILEEMDSAIERALVAIGMRAEHIAKGMCPVQTGLLRNSITFALDGKGPNIGQYKADSGGGSGQYAGVAPELGGGKKAVYIGTNVEYAPYVELGSSRRKTPKPFLKPAVEGHGDEYRRILEEYMKDGA